VNEALSSHGHTQHRTAARSGRGLGALDAINGARDQKASLIQSSGESSSPGDGSYQILEGTSAVEVVVFDASKALVAPTKRESTVKSASAPELYPWLPKSASREPRMW
jgi:hypothetical protein